jgi:branched-subunit amino acid ABC-type transport system permease component
MIQELIAYFFTNNAKTVLPIVEGVVDIFGNRTPRNNIFTALVCCLVIGLLWLLVNRTRTGKAVLAASMNPRGVTLLGLELTQIYIVVWGIYGILAGIAGVLLGMFLGVSSYSVGPLTASAFSIVVLGGLRRRLSRDHHGLHDLAGLSHHSGAAASGVRDVYPASRPAREALRWPASFPRACSSFR